VERVNTFVLFLTLEEMVLFSSFSTKLDIGFSYMVFIMLRHIPYIPSFFRAFIRKGCWFLLKTFFPLSIEMIIKFLSLILLMCNIELVDLNILNYPCIPGMKSTWLWCVIFFWCAFEFNFASVLLRIFGSMFIKESSYLYIFALLLGFVIRVIVAS
jgi:hypothetical protein